MKIHRAAQRGVGEQGWLHSRFSFSFAEYYDPSRMGFGALRVINDDVIEPGKGFGMHPHRDMEIITVVTGGAVEHRDSQGNAGVTKAGEVQYMSAGSGIEHSEFNPSLNEPLELFQIWIKPNVKGAPPRYAKCDFAGIDDTDRWRKLVSPDGSDGSMAIRQDATLFTAHLSAGSSMEPPPRKEGHGWLLFVAEGEVRLGDEVLGKRDEAQMPKGGNFTVTATCDAHLLLFDVPV